MTLRIMLVGLVASLGFELPNGADVSRWTRSGGDWVASRLADLSGPEVGALPCLATATDRHQAEEVTCDPVAPATQDRAFQAATAGVEADFAADRLAAHGAEAPAMLQAEATSPVGLPDGEEVAMADLAEEDPSSVEVAEPALAVELDDEGPCPSRAERLSSAVRLTREAVEAWAALIQDGPEDTTPSR